MHCDKNNLNLRIKTEPATAGADATVRVYIWLLYTGLVFTRRFRLLLGQCVDLVFTRRFRLLLGQCVDLLSVFAATKCFLFLNCGDGPY